MTRTPKRVFMAYIRVVNTHYLKVSVSKIFGFKAFFNEKNVKKNWFEITIVRDKGAEM